MLLASESVMSKGCNFSMTVIFRICTVLCSVLSRGIVCNVPSDIYVPIATYPIVTIEP